VVSSSTPFLGKIVVGVVVVGGLVGGVMTAVAIVVVSLGNENNVLPKFLPPGTSTEAGATLYSICFDYEGSIVGSQCWHECGIARLSKDFGCSSRRTFRKLPGSHCFFLPPLAFYPSWELFLEFIPTMEMECSGVTAVDLYCTRKQSRIL
jgi:hypothetical protein